jgi:hypothetical protein
MSVQWSLGANDDPGRDERETMEDKGLIEKRRRFERDRGGRGRNPQIPKALVAASRCGDTL